MAQDSEKEVFVGDARVPELPRFEVGQPEHLPPGGAEALPHRACPVVADGGQHGAGDPPRDHDRSRSRVRRPCLWIYLTPMRSSNLFDDASRL
ncbi:hypothetical protein Vau01_108740 [Virgisporangium aurantiacum]|uniref:Uncharacterized protein n=1 Tax=Virgisporangium aurantiacum TaxID=175570 RepID=A0A8J4E6P1_9ACTN|nr:hypothetical protein Vau01_108740 [Virgisporangium aurantiacum]